MRINNNVSALSAYNSLSKTDNAISKNLEKLSSGLRINRASDDAAGLTISEKMRAQVKGMNRAVSNAQDGISLLQTAEGSLNETHGILQRMNELATQAANDTLAADNRTAIKKEIDALALEIDNISKTEFNGIKLLDGTGGNLNIQIGSKAADTLSIALGGASDSATLAVTGLTVDTAANAQTSMTAIQTAIDTVSGKRADFGALQNRLDHTINNLNVGIENTTAAESRIRDTDMAKEMASFTKNQILSQAGTSMLAQANSKPQSVMSLLG